MAAAVRAVFPAGTGAGISTGATTVTTSVTAVSGDVLMVHTIVSVGTDTGFSVSATANSVAASGSSSAVHSNGQNAGFEQVFYWLTPSAGTYNVVSTVSGGTPDAIGQKIYAVSGADPSTPGITTFAPTGTGLVTAASVTSATMPTGSVGISAFCAGSNWTSTGQTTQLNVSPGGSSAATAMAGASATGSGSATTFTATISASDWYAAIATVWVQTGGAAAAPVNLTMAPISGY